MNSKNWTRQSGGASRAIIIGCSGCFLGVQSSEIRILTWTIDNGKFLVDVTANSNMEERNAKQRSYGKAEEVS